MRNIKAGQNANSKPTNGAGVVAPGRAAPDRSALERELLDEMTSWSPRDRGGAFRNWHRHALSLVHLNVLTALEAEGPLSMKRLAEAMDVADASATGIVDRMEKRGLVERRHGTDDRRQVLVYPTDAGKQVFRDMAAHRRSMLATVLGELGDDEIAGMLRGLRAIHAARDRILASQGPEDRISPDGARDEPEPANKNA